MGTITPRALQLARAFLGGPFTMTGGPTTIATVNIPNDGLIHEVIVNATLNVTSAITGGAITMTATMPNGAVLSGSNILTGGKAANAAGSLNCHVQAGSTLTVTQGTVSAGAGFVYISVWLA